MIKVLRSGMIKISNFKCIHTLTGHEGSIRSLINFTNSYFINPSEDCTIKIWSRKSFTYVRTLRGHRDGVLALFLLTSGCLASGSRDKTIKLWNIKNSECVATIYGHTGSVCSLALMTGRYLISGAGTNDNSIRVWDIKDNYRCINSMEGYQDWVSSLLVLKDNRLGSTSGDGTFIIWYNILN
jgi:WD40 repeat protein